MDSQVPNPKDSGYSRKARERFSDFEWELVDPTPEDLRDLDQVMEHDEFWLWASGKVDINADNYAGHGSEMLGAFKRLFKLAHL